MNTYQGCYKDGTNGTRDYRCWSGELLALGVFCRIVGLCVDASVEVNNRHPVLALHLLIVAMTVNAFLMVHVVTASEKEHISLFV